ncbi:ABC transporter substrate-binding protein [Alicyclobacillus sacchari]|uniref:ABC transporter substrate-binding protein n=1 Tax=Alicyclobacillus sacchari TaxID=392010 RepID=UPI0024E16202|nr:ABC transporter substrate-binding protein [Alicyclobacillus sacchari]
MAIDRQPIVNDVLGGMGGITNTFSVPGWPTGKYESGLSTNIAAAKQLLAKAGYPNGKGLPTIYLYAEVPSSNPSRYRWRKQYKRSYNRTSAFRRRSSSSTPRIGVI